MAKTTVMLAARLARARMGCTRGSDQIAHGISYGTLADASSSRSACLRNFKHDSSRGPTDHPGKLRRNYGCYDDGVALRARGFPIAGTTAAARNTAPAAAPRIARETASAARVGAAGRHRHGYRAARADAAGEIHRAA